MFARITNAKVQSGHFDQSIVEVENGFVTSARAQDGYRGFVLLANKERLELIGISFWDSESQMESTSSNDGYYHAKLSHFAQLLSAPAATSSFEVALREL